MKKTDTRKRSVWTSPRAGAIGVVITAGIFGVILVAGNARHAHDGPTPQEQWDAFVRAQPPAPARDDMIERRDEWIAAANARLIAAGQAPINREVFDREIARQQERIENPPATDSWEMARAQYQIQKELAKHIDDPAYAPTKH